VRALRDDAAPGVYNACDDSELKMGEWFDLIADRAGLPRPPRVARQDAATRIAPQLLSFMSESRRLSNAKLKRAWGLRLAYPTVFDGVPRRIGVATA
jgi:nucleoside-diphosphate-sugar epimerase